MNLSRYNPIMKNAQLDSLNNVRTALILTALMMLPACSGTSPTHLNGTQTTLPPCPSTPNCVSSLSQSENHSIPPFIFKGDATVALQKIEQIVKNLPRTSIIHKDKHYLHTEFSSRFFKFTDDVEFIYLPSTDVIHIKSASRIGRSDFGVNRERLEFIRSLFNQQND